MQRRELIKNVAGAAAGLAARGAVGAGRRLSEGRRDPALRRAVPARRADRRDGAPGRPAARRALEGQRRRRQPARQRRTDRRRCGREIAARRVDAARDHADPRRQRHAVPEGAVQLQQGPEAGGADGGLADAGGRAGREQDPELQGPDRRREGRQAERRLERQRHAAAPDARAVQRHREDRHPARAVQGRRAVDDRPDRRPARRRSSRTFPSRWRT